MKKLILAGAAALVLLVGLAGTTRADDVPGWNGDIKIHEGITEPVPVEKDDPKVCSFHLHALNFDSQEQVEWWIIKGEPFDSLPVLTDTIHTGTDGAYVSGLITLTPDHYKVFWAGEEAGGAKHKVFKVECVEPSTAPSTEPSLTPSVEPSQSVSPSISPSPSELSPTQTPSVSSPANLTPPPTDTESDDAVQTAATVFTVVLIGGAIVFTILLVVALSFIRGVSKNLPRF